MSNIKKQPTIATYTRIKPETVNAYQFEDNMADGFEYVCKSTTSQKCVFRKNEFCDFIGSGSVKAQNCQDRSTRPYLYLGGTQFGYPNPGDYIELLDGPYKRIWRKDEFEAAFKLEDMSDTEVLDEYDYFKFGEPDFEIVSAGILPEGWSWKQFKDGSGHLDSPTDKSYYSYDLQTKEFTDPSVSELNSWRFFEGYPYDCISLAQFKEMAEKWILVNIIKTSPIEK